MKVILKSLLRKLGNLLLFIGNKTVSLGNKLILLGNIRKPLHVRINGELKTVYKQTKGNSGLYIEKAFTVINNMVESLTVDGDFFNDYYILKSDVERQNTYFIPALLSVLISVSVTIVMDFAITNDYVFIDLIAGALLGIMTMAVIFIAHRMLFSTTYNIIYPYILEKMETKIKEFHKCSTGE